MANFLLITNEENWRIIKKENVMGLGGQWGKRFFPKLQIHDKCVIYITKISTLGGIYEISLKNTNKKIKWKTGSYNYLFEINPIKIPNKLIHDSLNNLHSSFSVDYTIHLESSFYISIIIIFLILIYLIKI